MERFPPAALRKTFHWKQAGIAKLTAELRKFRRSDMEHTISSVKHLVNSGVINAQELVRGGSHVNFIELALGAFPVEELVHRFVSRFSFEIRFDHQKQSPAQMRRATFGNTPRLYVNRARLVRRSVKTSKSGYSFPTVKPPGIANLSNKLRSENSAHAIHFSSA